MQVYIIMNQLDAESCDILGVFTEYEKAKLHWGEYVAEHPDAKCWVESHDENVWLYGTKNNCKIIHKTMVSKTTGIMSHVVSVSAEELTVEPVEEGEGWYTIRQVIDTFDEEEGKKKNLRLLEEYKKEK